MGMEGVKRQRVREQMGNENEERKQNKNRERDREKREGAVAGQRELVGL